MGQSRVSNDNLLTNRLISLEQEVKSLKVRQNYILDQAQWQKVGEITLSPTEYTYTYMEGQVITSLWILAEFEFEGVYPDMVADGYLLPTWNYPTPMSTARYSVQGTDQINKLRIRFLHNAEVTREERITFNFVANMPGVFRLTKQV